MKQVVRLSAPIQKDSIVDGEGLRTVIWFQGCPHHCPGCHNPSSHDYNGGFVKDVEDLIIEIKNLKIQDGITFSGGEPMFQPEALLSLAKATKEDNLNVWCFTGFTFEELMEMAKTNQIYLEIFKYIDVLVDGKFEIEHKSLNLKFKGSSNQRTIDVKKTLKKGEVVLISKYKNPRPVASIISNSKVKAIFI